MTEPPRNPAQSHPSAPHQIPADQPQARDTPPGKTADAPKPESVTEVEALWDNLPV